MSFIKHSVNIIYDNINDMISDTRLKTGMIVGVLGYFSPEDGMQGYYEIKESTDMTVDNGVVFKLGNNLYAIRTNTNDMTVKMFGAYGDGIHDDTDAIKRYLSYHKNIIFDNDKTYKLSSILTISQVDTIIDLNGSIINGNIDIAHTSYNNQNKPSDYKNMNVIIKNGTIESNTISVTNPISNIIIDNIEFKNNTTIGLKINNTSRQDKFGDDVKIKVINSKFDYNGTAAITNTAIYNGKDYPLYISNTIFNNQYLCVNHCGNKPIFIDDSNMIFNKYPSSSSFKPYVILCEVDSDIDIKNTVINNYHTVIYHMGNPNINIHTISVDYANTYPHNKSYFIYYYNESRTDDCNNVTISDSFINSAKTTTFFTNIAHGNFISSNNRFNGILNTPVDTIILNNLGMISRCKNTMLNHLGELITVDSEYIPRTTIMGMIVNEPFYEIPKNYTKDSASITTIGDGVYINEEESTTGYTNIDYEGEYKTHDSGISIKTHFGDNSERDIAISDGVRSHYSEKYDKDLYIAFYAKHPKVDIEVNVVCTMYIYSQSTGDPTESFTIETTINKPANDDNELISVYFNNIRELITFPAAYGYAIPGSISITCKYLTEGEVTISHKYSNNIFCTLIPHKNVCFYEYETNELKQFNMDKLISGFGYIPTGGPYWTDKMFSSITSDNRTVRIMSIPWISDIVDSNIPQFIRDYNGGGTLENSEIRGKGYDYFDIIPQQNGFSISKKYNVSSNGYTECILLTTLEKFRLKPTKYYFNANITTNGNKTGEGSLIVKIYNENNNEYDSTIFFSSSDKSEKIFEVPAGPYKFTISVLYSADTADNYQDLVMYVRDFYISESPYNKIITLDCIHNKYYNIPVYENGRVIMTPIEDSEVDASTDINPYNSKYLSVYSRGEVKISNT